MRTNKIFIATIVVSACVYSSPGDVVELKNGNIINGKYNGGTGSTLRIKNDAGEQVIDTSQVVAITFTAGKQAPAAPTPAAPGGTAPSATTPELPSPTGRPPQSATVTIPAGTTLLVRMMDSVSSKSAPGSTFSGRVETDVMAGNAVAVKAGTPVYGKVQNAAQAGRAAGKSVLDIRLTQIAPGGQQIPIVTSGYAEAGEASIRKAGRGAAAGAAVGAIAGDAGKGAAIGATAGALKRGETVTIPPGALLEFQLVQPASLASAQ
jgi:hypothetical protein